MKEQGILEISFGNFPLNRNKESERSDDGDSFESGEDRYAQNMLSTFRIIDRRIYRRVETGIDKP